MKVKLSYCTGEYGPDSGKAFYLETLDDSESSGTGFRVAGSKCYGIIKTVKSFTLGESELEDLIREAKMALKSLKKSKKK